MSSICENDYAINSNLNNYIVLNLSFKLGSLKLILKNDSDFTKKALELVLNSFQFHYFYLHDFI